VAGHQLLQHVSAHNSQFRAITHTRVQFKRETMSGQRKRSITQTSALFQIG
jgi:hypothetical protein